jgi:hypothetical protein
VGTDIHIHILLTLAVVGGKGSAFIPRQLYPWEKSPQYPLDKFQNWSGQQGKEKDFDPTRTQPLSHPAHSQLQQKCHKMKNGANMY